MRVFRTPDRPLNECPQYLPATVADKGPVIFVVGLKHTIVTPTFNENYRKKRVKYQCSRSWPASGPSDPIPMVCSIKVMDITDRLLKYFNRKKSESTDKNHTRYRNDICNHWDLDYLSMEEIDRRLQSGNLETTIARKKKDN